MKPSCAQLLSEAARELAAAGRGNSRGEGLELLAFVLGIPSKKLLTLLTDPVSEEGAERFWELVEKRKQGEPLQYLTGSQEFMGLDLFVDQNVLVPRWDTERMVELALVQMENYQQPVAVDVGTGSGAIIVSLAKFLPGGKYFAVDISEPALQVARKNACRHRVESRIRFIQGDLLTPFLKEEGMKFDFVLSNPPYIPAGELSALPVDVRREPLIALDGGSDGLLFYRRLIPQSYSVLHSGGHLFLEIGWNQAEAVAGLCRESGFVGVQVYQDYSGFNRVVSARKQSGRFFASPD